jgi:hypothetical protein
VEKLRLERLPAEPPFPARAQALDSMNTPIPKKSMVDSATVNVSPDIFFKKLLLPFYALTLVTVPEAIID